MPPEIETSSGGVESSDFTASNGVSSDDNDFSGSGGPGDSNFFSEEPVLESSSVTSDNAGNGDSGVTTGSGSGSGSGSADSWYDSATNNDAKVGNGSSGSFGANPFDDEANANQEEARLHSFHATDDLKDIHFNFDQYDLDSNSKKVLEQNATYLKSNPGIRVEIQGHCDERGTNNYNIALGQRRAHSTKKYLVAQGVNSHQVNVISYGEEKPFCSDSNENCWHQNRRAHFLVAK